MNTIDAASSAIDLFANGAAKAVSDARQATQNTGMTDDQRWAARAPLLAELAEEANWADRYPTATALSTIAVGITSPTLTPGDTTTYTECDILDGYRLGVELVVAPATETVLRFLLDVEDPFEQPRAPL